MRPIVVVPSVPVFGHATDFIERDEDVAIENFSAGRVVELLDIFVLGRLTGLDVHELGGVIAIH